MKSAPVRLALNARVGTTDGTQPDVLRELVIDVGRAMKFDAEGLPACRFAQVRGEGPRAARRACRGSVVGGGSAHLQISSPEEGGSQKEIARLTLFNGGVVDSGRRLLIHGLDPWTTGSRFLRATLSNRPARGVRIVLEVPQIAGGRGSVPHLKLKLGRKFDNGSTQRSYLRASCPRRGLEVSALRVLLKHELNLPGAAPRTVFRGLSAIPCAPALPRGAAVMNGS